MNGIDKEGCSPCKTLQFALTQISNDGDSIELLTSLDTSISGQTNISIHSNFDFKIQSSNNNNNISITCDQNSFSFGWNILNSSHSISISGIEFTLCQTALTISSASQVQIENCTFQSNLNDIFVESSNVEILNSFFIDAQNISLNVFNDQRNLLNVSNSIFSNGLSWAIFNLENDQSYFSNCQFSSQQSIVDEQTFLMMFEKTNATFLNSTFQVLGSGIGITMDNGVVSKFINCSFSRLLSIVQIPMIETSFSQATFQNCVFASGSGVLYSTSASRDSFLNCTFQNWTMAADTQLILSSSSGNLFDGCQFTGIDAFIITDSGSTSIVRNSVFSNNHGPLLNLLFGSLMHFEKNLFANNSVNGDGAIGIIQVSRASFVNCKFIGNNATVNAGCLLLTLGSDVLIQDCLFDSNLAGSGGGAVVSQDSSTTFRNVLFRNNNAMSTAGAVYSLRSSGDLFENCTFFQNEALIGGAVRLDAAFQENFTNCVFDSNAANFGPALYLTQAVLVFILNTNITNHESVTPGGAILSWLSIFTISNCRFEKQYAPTGK